MSVNASEEALASYLIKTRMAEAEQINDARDSQKMAAEHGLKLPLAEALVRLGVITQAQRTNLEKMLGEDQSPQLGNYKILKKLGAGTMGSVYLAEDTVAQRKVALKVLPSQLAESAEFLNRFQSEAQAMGKLNHVNIVSAFTVSHDKGKYYYAMEYCEGESLEAMLKREQVLSPGQALDIIKQVACGLEHAHSRGLVHRDIKPANIMVTPDGVAKILDLGLSKNIDNSSNSFSTMSGMAVGTPHYMSPEQARGNRNLDGRADIYSMGATLYHLVCGRPPFEGTDPDIIINKQVTEKAPNPSDINPDVPEIVSQVIERMLAKSPEDRYQKCDALIRDIDLVMNGQPPQLIPLEASRSSVEMRGVKMSDKDLLPAPPPGPRKSAIVNVKPPRPEKIEPHSHKPATRVRRKSNNTLIMAALLCLAGIGVLAAGVMSTMNAEKQNGTAIENVPPIHTKPSDPAEKPATPAPFVTKTVVPPPAPAVTPKPNPPPANSNSINLLAMIVPSKDTVAGAWWIQKNELYAMPAACARIEIPYQPPDEYDMKIEFTRLEGNDSVMMSLSKNAHGFCWKMADAQNTVMGFECISGKWANGNITTVKTHPCLINNKRYTAIVKVRNSNLKVYVEGQMVCDYNTNYSELNSLESWRLRDGRILGVGSFSSKTVFHSIELTEVTGKGKPTR